MSDQSSPQKPKPGSLRDRIAAFENKGPVTQPLVPPPPRPKPGGLSQWKPKPPSPPPTNTSPDHVQSGERKPPSTGGMSASDAMESIGRGGSLRERMAALQGKGAFGGPPPPIAPKPSMDRPKWKPPPAVPSSEDELKEGVDAARPASRSPPPRAVGSPPPENQETSNHDGDVVPQEGDDDPEEEERQRRATIAARMARLGGARFGMGPPIFAPKPVVRKAEPAPEVKDEESTVVKESNQALVTSPSRDLPLTVPEAITETEHKDEPESSPPVPTRPPTSMPMPVGPRRAAPPRKKASKNAPTVALPEPPVEEAEDVAAQSPPTTAEPQSADRAIQSLTTTDSQQEIGNVVEATRHEHPGITTDVEQAQTALAPVEVFHEAVEEAEEVHVEAASSRVEEESMHTAVDDQEVPLEQPSEVVEAEEEEEARRQRVAAKLTQMGAFNPLAGPLPIPRRQSLEEPTQAPTEVCDVEDEVNVDTEEIGETIPPPPAVLLRRETVEATKHEAAEPLAKAGPDDTKADEDDRVPTHHDAERAATSYAEAQGDEHDVPRPERSEDQPAQRNLVQGTTSTRETDPLHVSRTDLFGSDVRQEDPSGRGSTSEVGTAPPPRVTRPPPPPPVNFWSKPTPPSSPPLSPPPRTTLQSLRLDEEECPPSPDMPPRPIPPPGRSGSMTEDMPSPPLRRSMPPPPRRTSVRVTDPLAEVPSSAPTLPRPVGRRPDTPPIITTLAVQDQAAPEEHEQEHITEEETAENATPRPDGPEDEASVRRRAIAERMARLGGIRFGPPSSMNPLSRPPLPSAPPPTSIPPDELEQEEEGAKVGEGPLGEEDEDEAVKKQRIVAKLAGMGGLRLGMLPPPMGLPSASARRLVATQEDSESEDAVLPVPVPAPPQRLPPTRKPPPPIEMPVEQGPSEQARGGSRGTSDDGVQVEVEESDMEEVRYSDVEVPVGSQEDGGLTRRSTQTERSVDALPTPPPRMTSHSPPPGRPPIPTIPTALLGRRSSTMAGSVSASSSRQASLDEPSPDETPIMTSSMLRPQSEYVMVEAEEPDEDEVQAASEVAPPRRKSTRGSSVRLIPSLPPVPPPSAVDPPEVLTNSTQWEMPSIPQVPEFGEGLEMTSSGWSEDSTAVHVLAPVSAGSGKVGVASTASVSISGSGSGTGSGMGFGTGLGSGVGFGTGSVSGRRSMDQQPPLTTDDLMAIWGKTGVRVVEAATTLFEKSKRTLVGDGSHAGFVRAVLAQVPGVSYPRPAGLGVSSISSSSISGMDDNEWGYVVYVQTSNAVQRRVSDIMPGDVIAFWDAKLKGHKGLQMYTQTAGTGASAGTGAGESTIPSGTPLVGIVSEFDTKKSKVRVWQANQHVGQQTVENVSYRLDDMKTGLVKVYRVLEA